MQQSSEGVIEKVKGKAKDLKESMLLSQTNTHIHHSEAKENQPRSSDGRRGRSLNVDGGKRMERGY